MFLVFKERKKVDVWFGLCLFIHLVISVWSQSPVLVNKLSVAFIIHFDVQTIPVLVSGHPFKLDSVSPGRSSPGTSLLSGIKNVAVLGFFGFQST